MTLCQPCGAPAIAVARVGGMMLWSCVACRKQELRRLQQARWHVEYRDRWNIYPPSQVVEAAGEFEAR